MLAKISLPTYAIQLVGSAVLGEHPGGFSVISSHALLKAVVHSKEPLQSQEKQQRQLILMAVTGPLNCFMLCMHSSACIYRRACVLSWVGDAWLGIIQQIFVEENQ